MKSAVMPSFISFVAEQIPVGAGFIELFAAVIRTLAHGQGDGTVGELSADIRDNIAESLIGKPSVLASLQHKCAEAQIISLLTAGEDVFFGSPVSLGIWIAFSDTAVVTVVPAVVGELDEPADIDAVPVMLDTYSPCQFKEIFGGGRCPLPYECDPFTAVELSCQAELIDQRLYFLFSVIRCHMFFP